jgi:hypothetical protein
MEIQFLKFGKWIYMLEGVIKSRQYLFRRFDLVTVKDLPLVQGEHIAGFYSGKRICQ